MTRKTLLPLALMLASTMAHAEEPCWLSQNETLFPADKQKALASSNRAVVLHFGDNFNEIQREATIGAVSELRYRYCAFLGGPKGQLALFIDNKEGKRSFSEADAFKYLITVLERNAADFRLLEGCPQEREVLSIDDALALSSDRVVIQFGSEFPTVTMIGIQQALETSAYKFCSVQGGSSNEMNLFIGGNQGKRSFTPENAVQYLLTVLEQAASDFKIDQ
jgi:hypothetical protein